MRRFELNGDHPAAGFHQYAHAVTRSLHQLTLQRRRLSLAAMPVRAVLLQENRAQVMAASWPTILGPSIWMPKALEPHDHDDRVSLA